MQSDLGRLMVLEVVPIAKAYFAIPGNENGGAVHILLDGNVKDKHMRFCYEYALREGDHFGAALALLLLGMTKSQRGRVVNRAWYP